MARHPIRRRPESGWRIVCKGDMEKVDPLGLYEAVCDLCGKPLRYFVLLEHPEWRDILAGRSCAERLAGNFEHSFRKE